jgi:hypothetical protein
LTHEAGQLESEPDGSQLEVAYLEWKGGSFAAGEI